MKAITLLNRATGQIFTINRAQGRVARLRRRLFAWAELAEQVTRSNEGSWAVMVTMTYKSVSDWSKGHIRTFMLWIKKLARRKLLGYAWVAELQRRGAVHYHVLLVLAKGVRFPKPDKCGAWPYGSTRIEKAKTLYYICKYCQKGDDDNGNEYPRGARIYATWVTPKERDGSHSDNYRLSIFPKWLREVAGYWPSGTIVRRDPAGGFWVAGKLYISPYSVSYNTHA